MEISLREAGPADMPVVKKLFEEYASSLSIDLAFQGFAGELEGLPGKYAGPRGVIILAEAGGEPCGCVALRPLEGQACEMKRLYVRPSGRGRGLGRQLVGRIIEAARARRYSTMKLDTLPSMESAVALYRSFGFRDAAPYVYNPVPGALFMEKGLSEGHHGGGLG